MQNKLDKYTLELKNKLDNNYLSPLFIRLANLLYINESYDDCIEVCKTGLEIYPDYLTAKLILIKALLKSEYLNEAEIIFNEIKHKIPDDDMFTKFDSSIRNLKNLSGQEKIYYPRSFKSKYDFKTFDNKFLQQESLFSETDISDLLNNPPQIRNSDKSDYDNFINLFNTFRFVPEITPLKEEYLPDSAKTTEETDAGNLLSGMKIITETLADLHASQGNFKEAFEAYNFLIRAGTSNKKRIEDKLYELERNVHRKGSI